MLLPVPATMATYDDELTALRTTAHQQLEQCADELLQDRNVAVTPLLVSLIHFMVDKSADYQYPHIDRIWLGTWNAEVLADCLAHASNPQCNPPALLSHALIQRLDSVAARLHAVLLRSFQQRGVEHYQPLVTQPQWTLALLHHLTGAMHSGA